MQDLLNIYKYCCQEAFGGLKSLEYLPTNWIQDFPEAFDLQNENVISSPIVPKTGNDWQNVSVYSESIRFNEKSKENKQGEYVETLLSGTFPSRVNDIRRLYDRMRRHRFILKMTTSDNDVLIIGTPSTPLTFEVSNTRGEKIKDGHIFNFNFTGKTQYLAYIYAPV